MVPDPGATEYIVGRLGLTVAQAARSDLAIRVSHNVSKIKLITGQDPPFNVLSFLRNLHGIQDNSQ
jgi:hypothetical protein